MIYVCDAIMGTGKSSAAITYMNEHSSQRFIYITPYLSEAERIRKGCPQLRFVQPSDRLPEYNFKKSLHTAALIEAGANIATTHAAFKNYTPQMLQNIQDQKYTLLIDENVDVLEDSNFNMGDIQLALDAGYITERDGIYSIVPGRKYTGTMMRPLFSLLNSRELVRVPGDDNSPVFYWALPPSLFTSFKDVIIMTYMFSGQSLHHFLKIYDLPYTYIGIQKDDGGYRFCDYPGYTPSYVKDIGNLIDILDNERMNKIGQDYHSLSMSWYQKNEDKGSLGSLKNDVSNYYNNVHRKSPSNERLTGTYKSGGKLIRGKGYSNSIIPFNVKATNEYRDRDILVYSVNVFMNVNEKRFYKSHGIDVDEDAYATSVMVQWIWRSAIRDGKKIHIYIPSRRMRELLINWIDKVSKEGNSIEDGTT